MVALPRYRAVPRIAPRPRQRISAQSQPRFCTPIFRPGLPCPQEAEPSPQVPLSALLRFEVAQIDHQTFRRPFGYRGLSSASGLAPSAPTASDPAYPRPAESLPGRRYHGFCTFPERPPPVGPHREPLVDTNSYERFRAALVGPGALLVRWRPLCWINWRVRPRPGGAEQLVNIRAAFIGEQDSASERLRPLATGPQRGPRGALGRGVQHQAWPGRSVRNCGMWPMD